MPIHLNGRLACRTRSAWWLYVSNKKENLTPGGRSVTTLFALGSLLIALLAQPSVPAMGQVRRSAPAAPNPIQVENARPGTTAWMLTRPSTNHQIEGYASVTSAVAGQTAAFYVSTTAPSFRADVYRMGWYGGAGGRLMTSLPSLPGRVQAIPAPDPATGMVAAHWAPSFSLTIPSTWVSGMYLVKLTATTGLQAYIPLVVRAATPGGLVFVHAVNTDEAYNSWGGKSLYGDVHYSYGSESWNAHRAVKVSFNRPFSVGGGAGLFFNYEYDMVRWLERNGYDVSYITDVDENQDPGLLLPARAVLIVGHDEYWSKNIFDGLENAVAHGVNLGVFGDDTGSWQVRYESLDGAPDRVEVCYRQPRLDPLYGRDNGIVTTNWQAAPVNRPQQALLGMSHGGITHPAPWVVRDASSWVFADTNLKAGSSLPGLVGYEYGRVDPALPRPAHLEVLAESPVTNIYGQHSVAQSTLYTAASGARVVDMGSIEWAWGLDNFAPGFVSFPYNERPQVQSAAAETITANILRGFLQSPARHLPAPSRRLPAPASHLIFSTGFDHQAAGALQLQGGNASDRFSGAVQGARMVVENNIAVSRPNALDVSLTGGGSSYLYKTYAGRYAVHDLRFHLLLDRTVQLPHSAYVVLARAQPVASSRLGKVDLVMNASGVLFLDCTTASGARQYVWSKGGTALTRGGWHTLELQETVGSSGTLRLLLDGRLIGQASQLDLGPQGISYIAVGDVSTPPDRGTSGHLYFDDVVTSGAS